MKKKENLNHGTIPPSDIELEKSVLGALINESNAIHEVCDILKVNTFYKEQNQLIYGAIITLKEKNKPIDLLTVTAELRANGQLEFVGGVIYVVELTNMVNSSQNIAHYCLILEEHRMRRAIISISTRFIQSAYDNTADIFDLKEELQREITSIGDGHVSIGQKIGSVVGEMTEQMNVAKTSPNGIIGIPTLISEWDEKTFGLQAPDFIVLAGRPGSGKSSAAQTIATNVGVLQNIPVGIVSLEMSNIQIARVLTSHITEIPFARFKDGDLSEEQTKQMHLKLEKLLKANIYMSDSSTSGLYAIRALFRKWHQLGVRLFIIDYLQLIEIDTKERRGNREQEISLITRTLKKLARELNVPIIALSQLSRNVEARADKRPMLSDLRESGSIEQDADCVVFCYRPEYYGITKDDDGNPIPPGLTDFIFAKLRDGSLGTARAIFIGKRKQFISYEEEPVVPIKPHVREIRDYTQPIKHNGIEDFLM